MEVGRGGGGLRDRGIGMVGLSDSKIQEAEPAKAQNMPREELFIGINLQQDPQVLIHI